MASPPKGFFSALEEAIKQAPFSKFGAPPEQWSGYLKPGREVRRGALRFPLRKDELDWSGTKKFLDVPDELKRIFFNSDELLQDLTNRRLPTFDAKYGNHAVSYDSYVLPGPKNMYTENLTHWGPRRDPVKDLQGQALENDSPEMRTILIRAAHGDPASRSVIEAHIMNGASNGQNSSSPMRQLQNRALEANIRQLWNRVLEAEKQSQGPIEYDAPHFGAEGQNLLSHSRTTQRRDTSGEPVHLIEEMQSDWHQSGRQKGYISEINDLDRDKKINIINEMNNLRRSYMDQNRRLDPDQARRWSELERTIGPGFETQELRDEFMNNNLIGRNYGGIPDAPFRDTWHELETKKALRDAADADIPNVALTTGQQQRERYPQDNSDNFSQAYDRVYKGYLDRLAKQYGGETSRLSTIEKGKRYPTEVPLATWIRNAGHEDEFNDLLALAGPDMGEANRLRMNQIYNQFRDETERRKLLTDTNEVPSVRLDPDARKRIRDVGLPLFRKGGHLRRASSHVSVSPR